MEADGDGVKRVGERYVAEEQIGSGSFSVVWRGKAIATGQSVAIKEIRVEKLSGKLQESLQSEIAILQRIRHENIVQLVDIVKSAGRIFLVLEFCQGGDLSQFIRKNGRVNEPSAQHFMRQLAAGLQVLRSHNVIHRDLKPQNLLLSARSTEADLKIADFGFARSLQPQGLAETLCGSPLYMAPEILQCQKYDAKADLWSVGAILFELLVGRPPYGGQNHVHLLQNIKKNDVRIPPDIVDTLSPHCTSLIRALLKRNPVERLSFEEFFHHPFLTASHALQRAVTTEDLPASQPPVKAQPTAFTFSAAGHHEDVGYVPSASPSPSPSPTASCSSCSRSGHQPLSGLGSAGAEAMGEGEGEGEEEGDGAGAGVAESEARVSGEGVPDGRERPLRGADGLQAGETSAEVTGGLQQGKGRGKMEVLSVVRQKEGVVGRKVGQQEEDRADTLTVAARRIHDDDTAAVGAASNAVMAAEAKPQPSLPLPLLHSEVHREVHSEVHNAHTSQDHEAASHAATGIITAAAAAAAAAAGGAAATTTEHAASEPISGTHQLTHAPVHPSLVAGTASLPAAQPATSSGHAVPISPAGPPAPAPAMLPLPLPSLLRDAAEHESSAPLHSLKTQQQQQQQQQQQHSSPLSPSAQLVAPLQRQPEALTDERLHAADHHEAKGPTRREGEEVDGDDGKLNSHLGSLPLSPPAPAPALAPASAPASAACTTTVHSPSHPAANNNKSPAPSIVATAPSPPHPLHLPSSRPPPSAGNSNTTTTSYIAAATATAAAAIMKAASRVTPSPSPSPSHSLSPSPSPPSSLLGPESTNACSGVNAGRRGVEGRTTRVATAAACTATAPAAQTAGGNTIDTDSFEMIEREYVVVDFPSPSPSIPSLSSVLPTTCNPPPPPVAPPTTHSSQGGPAPAPTLLYIHPSTVESPSASLSHPLPAQPAPTSTGLAAPGPAPTTSYAPLTATATATAVPCNAVVLSSIVASSPVPVAELSPTLALTPQHPAKGQPHSIAAHTSSGAAVNTAAAAAAGSLPRVQQHAQVQPTPCDVRGVNALHAVEGQPASWQRPERKQEVCVALPGDVASTGERAECPSGRQGGQGGQGVEGEGPRLQWLLHCAHHISRVASEQLSSSSSSLSSKPSTPRHAAPPPSSLPSLPSNAHSHAHTHSHAHLSALSVQLVSLSLLRSALSLAHDWAADIAATPALDSCPPPRQHLPLPPPSHPMATAITTLGVQGAAGGQGAGADSQWVVKPSRAFPFSPSSSPNAFPSLSSLYRVYTSSAPAPTASSSSSAVASTAVPALVPVSASVSVPTTVPASVATSVSAPAVCAAVEAAFIEAVERGEAMATFLDRDDPSLAPDALELIFQAALAAGRAGAVEEVMGHMAAASDLYSHASALFLFLAQEAPSLPLSPPLSLPPTDCARLQKYQAAVAARQRHCSKQVVAMG